MIELPTERGLRWVNALHVVRIWDREEGNCTVVYSDNDADIVLLPPEKVAEGVGKALARIHGGPRHPRTGRGPGC